MFKLFNDLYNYQSYFIDHIEFTRLLAPCLGRAKAMGLSISATQVQEIWKPLEVEVFQNENTVDLPDLSIWRDLIIMNQRAHEALSDLLSPFGEFLPVELLGKNGYLYHCTNIHHFSETEVTYQMHGDIYAGVTHLQFSENFDAHIVTGIHKVNSDMYCSEAVAKVIQDNKLTGLLLIKDLTVMAPY